LQLKTLIHFTKYIKLQTQRDIDILRKKKAREKSYIKNYTIKYIYTYNLKIKNKYVWEEILI